MGPASHDRRAAINTRTAVGRQDSGVASALVNTMQHVGGSIALRPQHIAASATPAT